MSELKEHLFCECDEIVREYRGQLSNEMRPYYLKSEADKVITELEMKLAKAKLVLRLNEPKALYSNLDTMSRLNHKIDVVERRELHQKYKRCLAMASACDASMAYFGEFYDDASKRMVAHYYKWRGRWYELAERFKEAK
jgi:hypothetical protein